MPRASAHKAAPALRGAGVSPWHLLPAALATLGACAESPIAEQELDAALDNSWTVDATLVPTEDGSVPEPGESLGAQSEQSMPGTPDGATAPRVSDGGTTGDARVAVPPVADARVPAAMDAATPVKDAAVPPREAATMMPTCSEPQRSCNGRCLDARSDAQNCGSCGHRCDSGESCVESRCWKEPPQSCSSKAFQGHAYLFCNQNRSWSQARDVCLEADMDLTIVTSAAENDFVRSAGNDIWLGASDLQTEGTFTWVPPGTGNRTNGAALDYKNWPQGEPNNTKGCDGLMLGDRCLGDETDEDCAMAGADGRWNDTNCAQERRYVCEAY